MTTHHTFKVLLLSTALLLTAPSSLAANIPVLNHNFESDAIPPDPGYTTRISGWVNSGLGSWGAYSPNSPQGKGKFNELTKSGLVAYVNGGGKFYQTSTAQLLTNETYTLNFDVGFVNNTAINFAARIKANGLVVAQLNSTAMNLIEGEWTNQTLSFTTTNDMPVGSPVVIEFANLSTEWDQVNLDNISFSTAGTATTLPGTQLGALTLITQNATLLVPDQFPNINVALRYLDDKQIKVGKTVTIQVTDCDHHVYTESVEVAHPNGDAIHIIGDVESPESCALRFEDVSGFVAQNGNRIGLIDGFTITGNASSDTSQLTKGVYANQSAYIHVGRHVVVTEFTYGMMAYKSSTIAADYTAAIANVIEGYLAHVNSHITADYSKAERNGRFGYQASQGSRIEANDAVSTNNDMGGFATWNFSSMSAVGATASQNGNWGFRAVTMSFIYGHDTQATGNNDANYSPQRHRFGNSNSYIN